MQASPAAKATDQTPRPSWVHLRLVVSLVPPAPGRAYKIDINAKRTTVTICAPWQVVTAGAVLVLGGHPWFAPVVKAARHLFGL